MSTVAGIRWTRASWLATFVTGALTAWLLATAPRTPPSFLVGPSADAVVQADAHAAYLKFTERLKHLAGPNAKDCGAMALTSVGKDSLLCGADSLANGRPFWLAIEYQREDSLLWTGLVQDAQGSTYRIEFDSQSSQDARHTLPGVFKCNLTLEPSAVDRRKFFSCPFVPVS